MTQNTSTRNSAGFAHCSQCSSEKNKCLDLSCSCKKKPACLLGRFCWDRLNVSRWLLLLNASFINECWFPMTNQSVCELCVNKNTIFSCGCAKLTLHFLWQLHRAKRDKTRFVCPGASRTTLFRLFVQKWSHWWKYFHWSEVYKNNWMYKIYIFFHPEELRNDFLCCIYTLSVAICLRRAASCTQVDITWTCMIL